MKLVAPLLLAVAAVGAAEPDGAVAPAMRWTGPRGCASGSLRSDAAPVVTEIEEAWSLAFEQVTAPVVHWDGRGYAAVLRDKKPYLIAFDLRTGKELAKKSLKTAPREIHVWDHTVFCRVIEGQITGYRVRGRTFATHWRFRGRRRSGGKETPGPFVVQDNEIYAYAGGNIERLRVGSNFPVWTTGDPDAHGAAPPVVYGNQVLSVGFDGDEVLVKQYRRLNGARLGRQRVAHMERWRRSGRRPELTVTPRSLFIRTPGDLQTAKQRSGNYAIVPYTRVGEGKARLDSGTYVGSYVVSPASTPRGTLCLSDESTHIEWQLQVGVKYWVVTSSKQQPDLFASPVPPTVLRDVVYFGRWAADLATREILWRLPVERVTYPVVPADRMLIVVENGTTLRAFRGRGEK